jgi:hypothetical protein
VKGNIVFQDNPMFNETRKEWKRINQEKIKAYQHLIFLCDQHDIHKGTESGILSNKRDELQLLHHTSAGEDIQNVQQLVSKHS